MQITSKSSQDSTSIQEYIHTYSETLIRSFIDKLTIINLLNDHEFPFRLLKSFVSFSDLNTILKYTENLLTHLNRHFDLFYLKEDFKTIRLIFPLYKIILEVLNNSFTKDKEQSLKIIQTSNIIRLALMRVKPFILLKEKYLAHYSLDILKISCFTLSCIFFTSQTLFVNEK